MVAKEEMKEAMEEVEFALFEARNLANGTDNYNSLAVELETMRREIENMMIDLVKENNNVR
ncbi:MAG: hypothetical protein K2H01_11080 [Ruminococcus sp.]|nr:hypothetical protein [Ruminococcus sp.]